MARTAIVYAGASRDGVPSALAALAALAGVEGIDIVAVVDDGHGRSRAGLAAALEPIAAGDATLLVAPRLDMLAGSLPELVALLDWLTAAGADLLALDVRLDTGAPSGRRSAALLREIDGWGRAGGPGRGPRGRPGLAARAPALGERIAAMRARGLSLQAIADALDAEKVPTPRGGARWRASSVQAALGYRRPRPPVPGAPPPRPRHGPGHPPHPGPPGPPHLPRP